ncbi:MAG: hypothetical protein GY867_08670 [bacterium]|nr:hypothetical protein [bacterium]
MRKGSAVVGVISGVLGATSGILLTDQPFMLDLPFGWQLVICCIFGALLGSLGGLAYRWFSSRTQNQQQ